MTIRILLDQYGMESHADIMHVNAQSDYVPSLRRISAALAEESSLMVSVHNPAMFPWYDQFQQRNGIVIAIVEPARVLAENLGVGVGELPDSIRLNPDVIVAEKLVQRAKENPPGAQQSILSWLLKEALGSVWMDASLTEPSQLMAILADYASGRLAALHPCFIALRDEEVKHWVASGSPYRNVLSWLLKGRPNHRATSLILLRILSQYPRDVQVGALSFEGRWAELAELDAAEEVARLLPASCGSTIRIPASVSQEAEKHLQHVLATGGLAAAAEIVSGALQGEHQVIRAYLVAQRRGLSLQDKPVLERLAQIFKSAGGGDAFVSFLESIVPSPEPGPLAADASWTAVQRWIEREYMPYYAWASAIGSVERTADGVSEFEGWLLNHFVGLCRTHSFAPYAFRQVAGDALRAGPVLIIVIDGMSWSAAGVLRRSLARKGLRCKPASGHVCAIPSITRIAKPSLLAGRMLAQVKASGEDERDYERLVQEWTGVQAESCACATSNRQSIEELLVVGRRVYLYLYNDIDAIIHKSVDVSIRSRLIQQALDLLAEDLSQALTSYREATGSDIGVIICSDHGYTELPVEGGAAAQPPDAECDTSHGRIAELPATSASLADDRFISLDEQITGDAGTVYCVGKGYTCVGAKPRGATHGGLTPQEVYVSQIVLARDMPTAYADIQVAVMGAVKRGRAGNPVTLRIMNPNTVAVDLLELSVDMVAVTGAPPCRVEPGGTCELTGMVDARQVASEQMRLGGVARVDCMGEVSVTEFSVQVETTGAAVVDKGFEDGFDV